MLKKLLKSIAARSPFALTKNEYYDRQTESVIKKVCQKNSVCVDVGAHNGKILAMFIKHCPLAMHYAFEPLPEYYKLLVRRYGSASQVYKLAISITKRDSPYNLVVANPAYSGLKKQPLSFAGNNQTIVVQTDTLDNIIPPQQKIKLVKLDIEGGEYDALQGARQTLAYSNPYVLFEFGKGGSDVFQVTAGMIFKFFLNISYQIFLLDDFLHDKEPLTMESFAACYVNGIEYFFIACPVSK